jgi:hypothetical protein
MDQLQDSLLGLVRLLKGSHSGGLQNVVLGRVGEQQQHNTTTTLPSAGRDHINLDRTQAGHLGTVNRRSQPQETKWGKLALKFDAEVTIV